MIFLKDLIFSLLPYTLQTIGIDALDLGQLYLFSCQGKIRYSVFFEFHVQVLSIDSHHGANERAGW